MCYNSYVITLRSLSIEQINQAIQMQDRSIWPLLFKGYSRYLYVFLKEKYGFHYKYYQDGIAHTFYKLAEKTPNFDHINKFKSWKPPEGGNPYGDGKASFRIAQKINDFFY